MSWHDGRVFTVLMRNSLATIWPSMLAQGIWKAHCLLPFRKANGCCRIRAMATQRRDCAGGGRREARPACWKVLLNA